VYVIFAVFYFPEKIMYSGNYLILVCFFPERPGIYDKQVLYILTHLASSKTIANRNAELEVRCLKQTMESCLRPKAPYLGDIFAPGTPRSKLRYVIFSIHFCITSVMYR